MNFSGITVRRTVAGVWAGCVLGGLAGATIAAPTAAAAPVGCSAGEVSSTVNSSIGSARQYLDNRSGRQSGGDGRAQPTAAAGGGRCAGLLHANPREYYELRDILAPIGDVQRQCDVTALPPGLASAYDQFMAG